jgi:uncharacterized metal-binding protein
MLALNSSGKYINEIQDHSIVGCSVLQKYLIVSAELFLNAWCTGKVILIYSLKMNFQQFTFSIPRTETPNNVVEWVTLLLHIVVCTGVHVTKITGSRSDDWIYWHFGYNLSQ